MVAAGGRRRSSARWRCRRSGWSAAAFLPDAWTTRSSSVVVETPPGSNLAYTQLKAQEVATIARSLPEVAYTYTSIGGQTEAVDEGTVYVRLMPQAPSGRGARRTSRPTCAPELLNARRRRRRGSTPASSATSSRSRCSSRGPDARRTGACSPRAMRDEVRAGARVRWTSACRPRARSRSSTCVIDRGLAGSLGVTVGQVAQALRPAFAGIDAGDWIDPEGETRDVNVRLAPEARTDVRDLVAAAARRAGPGRARSLIPLGQVARLDDQHRAGAHRSPQSRSRDHDRGQHRGPVAATRSSSDIMRAGDRERAAAGRLRALAGRRDRRTRPRCSAASSPRSASRCC